MKGATAAAASTSRSAGFNPGRLMCPRPACAAHRTANTITCSTIVSRAPRPNPRLAATASAHNTLGSLSHRQKTHDVSTMKNAAGTSVVTRWPCASKDGWKTSRLAAMTAPFGPSTSPAQSATSPTSSTAQAKCQVRARSNTGRCTLSTCRNWNAERHSSSGVAGGGSMRRGMPRKPMAAHCFASGGCSGFRRKSPSYRCR